MLDPVDMCEDDFDQEELLGNNVSNFFEEIRPIIIKTIKNYFSNKKLYNGKDIDLSWFDLPYYSELIISTTVSEGVLKAYKIIEENNFSEIDFDNDIASDIKYLIRTIKNIQKYVPQEFVGGMILLHLELIEGFEIW
jgi:hypothetical protein